MRKLTRRRPVDRPRDLFPRPRDVPGYYAYIIISFSVRLHPQSPALSYSRFINFNPDGLLSLNIVNLSLGNCIYRRRHTPRHYGARPFGCGWGGWGHFVPARTVRPMGRGVMRLGYLGSAV